MTKYFDKAAFMAEFQAATEPSNNPKKPAERLFKGAVLLEILDGSRPLKEHQVHLYNLESFQKGRGHAKEAMQALTALADKYNIGIVVDAEPLDSNEGSLGRYGLFKFYKSHGFNGIPSCYEMYRPSTLD